MTYLFSLMRSRKSSVDALCAMKRVEVGYVRMTPGIHFLGEGITSLAGRNVRLSMSYVRRGSTDVERAYVLPRPVSPTTSQGSNINLKNLDISTSSILSIVERVKRKCLCICHDEARGKASFSYNIRTSCGRTQRFTIDSCVIVRCSCSTVLYAMSYLPFYELDSSIATQVTNESIYQPNQPILRSYVRSFIP